MATYKVTLLSEAENLNVTIDCPDDKFILEAAVIAFNVNGFNFELSCSAINKTDIILLLPHF